MYGKSSLLKCIFIKNLPLQIQPLISANHPIEHKTAAYRYITCMHSLPFHQHENKKNGTPYNI